MVIINIVTINSLKGKSFCHFSKIKLERETAETPNKNPTKIGGISRKIVKNPSDVEIQMVQIFTTERIKPVMLVEKIEVFVLSNFIFIRANIKETIIKIPINREG